MANNINIYFGANNDGDQILNDKMLVKERTVMETGLRVYRMDSDFIFYSFYELEDDSDTFAVNCKLPDYFECYDPNHNMWSPLIGELNGTFLIRVDDKFQMSNQGPQINQIRKVLMGQSDQGCAKFLPIHPYNYFHFNHNYFFPMLMNDFSVVFYGCEEVRKKEWQDGINLRYSLIGLYAPPVRDTTLGIYMTRRAALFVDESCAYEPCTQSRIDAQAIEINELKEEVKRLEQLINP